MNLSELLPDIVPEDLYSPVMAEIKEMKRLTSADTASLLLRPTLCAACV